MKIFELGLIITTISWIFAWTKIPPLYEHTFFPLWLGYIFTINGISEVLLGTSLLTKMRKKFILLFLISIPFWWFFEFLNSFTQNWQYILPRPVSNFEYLVRASINFSTVIPSVASTSFLLYRILNLVKSIKCRSFSLQRTFFNFLFILGLILFLSISLFPKYTFPFFWIIVLFLLEPLNFLFNFPSVFKDLLSGNLNLIISVGLATLLTGFFWEMWNFYSLPKWVYFIPLFNFFKIFEMPVLGYLGYPFFGLEVYSFCAFIFGILKKIFRLKISHFQYYFRG